MPIVVCSVPALADCTSGFSSEAGVTGFAQGNHQRDKTPIALCSVGRYIPRSITNSGPAPREAEKSMRAEVERLVEEIKQSVGLLRRHL